MSIEYKFIDEEEVTEAVKESRAREADLAAYNLDLELKRLELRVSLLPTNERLQYVTAIQAARTAAAQARARANRLGRGVVVHTEETVADKRNFIRNNLFAIEHEHAARVLIVEQRREALAMTGKDSPSETERVSMQTRLEEDERKIAELEFSWKMFVSELELLPPGPLQPVAPIGAEPEGIRPPNPRDLLTPEEIEAQGGP